MDKLTDILTTFFVNSNSNTKHKSKVKSSESSSSESSESSSSESSESSSSESSESSSSESSESSTKKPEEKQSGIYSDLSSLNENTVQIPKEQNEKMLEEIPQEIPQETSQEIQEETSQEIPEEIPQEIQEEIGLKKYILKPSQFYKKNISIVTDGIEGGIEILSDLLYKLSLIRDVDKIYDNTIHIVSDIDNKKLYKQMLLDNPYLYFTNFDVKHVLTKRNIVESISDKRSIYIFDNIMVNKYKDLVNSIIDKNVHILVLSNHEDKTGFDTHSCLGGEKILLYKPNKLKMIHKKFYRYYVKPLSLFADFDTYYITVNDENLDLKYIIIKDDELKYN